MEVSPRLRQALSVDTNISYSLDMSKFPGLDDPHHQTQPALLIASSTHHSNSVKDTKLSEIIPSPTLDIAVSPCDLLEDILSVIEKHDTAIDPRNTQHGTDIRRHHPNQLNKQMQFDQQRQTSGSQQMCAAHALYHKDTLQTVSTQTSSISKYAMDMIFHTLIYPEVGLGGSYSLDTLIQSAPKEYTRQHCLYRSTGDYLSRLNTITGSGDTSLSSSSLRYGKRKRESADIHCDLENTKRLRYGPRISTAHGVWSNVVSHVSYPSGRLITS